MTEDEARAVAIAMIPSGSAPMPLSELESHLGAAADLLRGSIDQADFKAFIFPLMFFKRINDVYMEEYVKPLLTPEATTSSLPSPRTTASPSP